jgi:hypothetical protein
MLHQMTTLKTVCGKCRLRNKTVKPFFGDDTLYPFSLPLRVNKPQEYKSYVDYYYDHFADTGNSNDLNRAIYSSPLEFQAGLLS